MRRCWASSGCWPRCPGRLRLLTGSRDRGAPPRQRTLQATLRWSHDLLAPREQRLFRRLAVVAGSASLALVQTVAQGPDEAADPWEVLDALDELVQRTQDIVHAALGEQEAAAQARIGAALPDEALAALAFEAPAPAG